MRVLASRLLLLTLLLIICAASHALDPPTLMWERQYFTDRSAWFFHVIQTSDGGFGVSAAVAGSTAGNRPIVKMDSDGNIEWDVTDIYWYQNTRWLVELPDSSLLGVGETIPQSGDPVGLYMLKVSKDGDFLWSKVYNFTSGFDGGFCVTELPDGGFAVCGEYNSNDALIIRTDANGDTLWTRIYDLTGGIKAFRVLHVDDGLTVFADCHAGGPYLLRYAMDGELLWDRDYTGLLPLGQEYAGDMCLSSDFGYMIASSTSSHIGQTDWLGYLIWNKPIPGSLRRCGLSLNPTMDDGYIFSGWEGLYEPPELTEYSQPADTGVTEDGWLVKLDSLGNSEWHIQNELGIPQWNNFYCARQLQGGGYIVAGTIGASSGGPNGYLLRYAPETGIEGPAPSLATTLSAAPNPFSSSLRINYSLPEPAQIALSVYDLSGRVVADLGSISTLAGEHSTAWNPTPTIPDGCYLIVLDANGERAVRRAVLLR